MGFEAGGSGMGALGLYRGHEKNVVKGQAIEERKDVAVDTKRLSNKQSGVEWKRRRGSEAS